MMTSTKSVDDIYELEKYGANVKTFIPRKQLKHKDYGFYVRFTDPRTVQNGVFYDVKPFATSGGQYFIICPYCGELHCHTKLGRQSSQCLHSVGFDENGKTIWSRDNTRNILLWYTILRPGKYHRRADAYPPKRGRYAKSKLYAANKVQQNNRTDKGLSNPEGRSKTTSTGNDISVDK